VCSSDLVAGELGQERAKGHKAVVTSATSGISGEQP